MSDTINVYLLETVENLKWNHICSMQKYVSVQRQKRINAYRFERDRISSLVTALMTRMIIQDWLNIVLIFRPTNLENHILLI